MEMLRLEPTWAIPVLNEFDSHYLPLFCKCGDNAKRRGNRLQIYSVFGLTPSIPSIYSFGVVAQLVHSLHIRGYGVMIARMTLDHQESGVVICTKFMWERCVTVAHMPLKHGEIFRLNPLPPFP